MPRLRPVCTYVLSCHDKPSKQAQSGTRTPQPRSGGHGEWPILGLSTGVEPALCGTPMSASIGTWLLPVSLCPVHSLEGYQLLDLGLVLSYFISTSYICTDPIPKEGPIHSSRWT